VENAPILRDARVGDELFDLLAGVHRQCPPGRILVGLLRQVTLDEHAGRGIDELVRDGVLENLGHGEEHLVDGPRRQLPLRSQFLDRAADVPWTHVAQEHGTDARENVLSQPGLVIGQRFETERAAAVYPSLRVPLDGDGRRRWDTVAQDFANRIGSPL
jgi:hypothetical protein